MLEEDLQPPVKRLNAFFNLLRTVSWMAIPDQTNRILIGGGIMGLIENFFGYASPA